MAVKKNAAKKSTAAASKRRPAPASPIVKSTLKHTRIQTAEGWKRSKTSKA